MAPSQPRQRISTAWVGGGSNRLKTRGRTGRKKNKRGRLGQVFSFSVIANSSHMAPVAEWSLSQPRLARKAIGCLKRWLVVFVERRLIGACHDTRNASQMAAQRVVFVRCKVCEKMEEETCGHFPRWTAISGNSLVAQAQPYLIDQGWLICPTSIRSFNVAPRKTTFSPIKYGQLY